MKKPIEVLKKARNQINQAIDELTEQPDIGRVDYHKEYELGTQYIFPDGAIYKYGRVDFGTLAASAIYGEIINVQYRWFAINNLAKINRHQ